MKSKFIALISFSVFIAPALAMEQGAKQPIKKVTSVNSWRDPKIIFVAKAKTLPDFSSRDAITKYLFTKLAEKDKEVATSFKEAFNAKNDAIDPKLKEAVDANKFVIKMYHEDKGAVLLYGLFFIHKLVRHTLIYSPANPLLMFKSKNGLFKKSIVNTTREVIVNTAIANMGSQENYVISLLQYGIRTLNYANVPDGIEIYDGDLENGRNLCSSFGPFLSKVSSKHAHYDEKQSQLYDDLVFASRKL